jgi:DNA-binding beta-propeller fold protein YncE
MRRGLTKTLAVLTVLLISSVAVLATISFITKWGSSGVANGEFLVPTGIATDAAGNVYVAEGNGNRFQKFDNNGAFLMAVGIPGDLPGGFVSPSGLAGKRLCFRRLHQPHFKV